MLKQAGRIAWSRCLSAFTLIMECEQHWKFTVREVSAVYQGKTSNDPGEQLQNGETHSWEDSQEDKTWVCIVHVPELQMACGCFRLHETVEIDPVTGGLGSLGDYLEWLAA